MYVDPNESPSHEPAAAATQMVAAALCVLVGGGGGGGWFRVYRGRPRRSRANAHRPNRGESAIGRTIRELIDCWQSDATLRRPAPPPRRQIIWVPESAGQPARAHIGRRRDEPAGRSALFSVAILRWVTSSVAAFIITRTSVLNMHVSHARIRPTCVYGFFSKTGIDRNCREQYLSI